MAKSGRRLQVVPPPLPSVVLIDTCTFQNFAVVRALNVLRVRFGERAHWTEAVRYEVRRGVVVERLLQDVLDAEADWLGKPWALDEGGDESVDLIRRGLGGTESDPLLHLGEAECIRALERTNALERIFVTDDRPAADFARRRRHVRVMDTADVLAEAYAYGELGCPQAYDLLKAMHNYPAGPREVRIPPHHHVC